MTKKDEIQNKEPVWKFTNNEIPMEAVYDVSMGKFIVWKEVDVNDKGVVTSHFVYEPDEVEAYLSKGVWKKT